MRLVIAKAVMINGRHPFVFSSSSPSMTHTQDFLAPLSDLAVVRIAGNDAVSFLQAQLSNDIAAIGPVDARLAAYCNAKGRMQASLVLWQETGESGGPLLAAVKSDLVEPLLKRLRMFVLRAKVEFDITSLTIYGYSRRGGSETNSSGAAEPWKVVRQGARSLISAPTKQDGPLRQWVVTSEAADVLSKDLNAPLVEANAWHTQDIEAGLGWVEHGNVELFIPQSLNYDLNGGVSFTKGCYPGQEVVARAHYRGAVKRRGFPAHCRLPQGTALKAGDDIFDAKRPKNPAGRIINAAPAAPKENVADSTVPWYVFVELNTADVGVADLRAVSPEGPALDLLPLPYSIESD